MGPPPRTVVLLRFNVWDLQTMACQDRHERRLIFCRCKGTVWAQIHSLQTQQLGFHHLEQILTFLQ
jgi:hypothetical protein